MQFLVMSWSESLAAFGAAPLEHEAAIFAGHARAKTVGLRPSSIIRLKSALRHSDESPLKTKTLRLIFVSGYVKKTAGQSRWTTEFFCTGTVPRQSLFSLFNVACFIRLPSLDRPETSMLVSAGFEKDQPVNS